MTKPRPGARPALALSHDQALTMRLLYAHGAGYVDLERRFGVGRSVVSAVIHGRYSALPAGTRSIARPQGTVLREDDGRLYECRSRSCSAG